MFQRHAAAVAAIALVACSHQPSTKSEVVGPLRLAYLDNAQVHVVDVDGGHDSTVTPNGDQVVWYVWHRDSQRIAYYAIDRTVHILDRVTGTNVVVTTLPHPQWISWFDWSPDGSRLMAVDSGRVMIVSAAGDNPVTLASNLDVSAIAKWTADGQYIVVSGGPLTIIPVNGGAIRTINAQYAAQFPDPSPDGGTIAFSMAAGVWLVAASGGTPNEILVPGAADYFQYPRWSPDGRRLLGINNQSTIWIANANGSGLQQWQTSSPTGARASIPEWSPDGSLVAYISGTSASYDVTTMHADGSGLTTVSHAGQATVPHWVR